LTPTPPATPATPAVPAAPDDPFAPLRTKKYRALLLLAALLGVPISAAAWGFLYAIDKLQTWVFTDLPKDLGFHSEPTWWPLLPLVVAGVLVGLTIKHLPGTCGHPPAEGFKAGGAPEPIELPGIFLAALASLALGVVIGPEAPLIALGGGLAVCAVRLAKRDVPPMTVAMVAAAGSFAAISALLGSPILAAFLLMEGSGIGGPMLGIVLVPGLLAAGVGSLIFIGLDSWTGLGTFSLVIPNLPPFARPDGVQFLWAVAIGLAATVVGSAIRWLALYLQPRVERRMVLLTPVTGLAIAGCAIAYFEITGMPTSEVLFSGQTDLTTLVANSAAYSAGALVALVAFKGLAYSVSLSSFRGGPIFPAMFIGAAGGIAMSHLPGLPLVPGVAMGIGAMSVVMLRLPLTSVMLATLLLAKDGLAVMPLVIVAVVIAYVASATFAPRPAAEPAPAPT
jgi:chloride channel protein, CIC family